MPTRLAVTTELVGRDEELTLLRARLDGACAATGGIVLVNGEPGSGKTRLLEELAADAAMSARAPPCSGPGPRPCALLRDRDSEALRADLGPAAADLAQLLPEL